MVVESGRRLTPNQSTQCHLTDTACTEEELGLPLGSVDTSEFERPSQEKSVAGRM